MERQAFVSLTKGWRDIKRDSQCEKSGDLLSAACNWREIKVSGSSHRQVEERRAKEKSGVDMAVIKQAVETTYITLMQCSGNAVQ